jgi:hypothetical protein
MYAYSVSVYVLLSHTHTHTHTPPGVQVDREIGKFVTFTVGDVHVDRSNVLKCKYDRVGIVQVPGFMEPREYDFDNIEVTEATQDGVTTQSLREVCEGALSVSVRHMKIGAEYRDHLEEEEEERKHKKKNKKPGKKKSSSGGGFMNYGESELMSVLSHDGHSQG